MSVAEIEKAVSGLSADELKQFRAWFADFDMAQWDKEIEEDAASGRLDSLAAKAMEDYRAGRFTEL
jgi:hypothetical protein